MALSPGTQLGSYRIVSSVGAGGMGEVYRASDTRLGRDVAVKILPEHLSGMADARERFEREARVISSLSHPNICTLFDVGTHNDVSYLVMELLEGETLATRLQRGPLKLEEALRCGAQVADALDKAHRRGIVHRDLKPANLMMSKAGVKVLDFGVAKLREEQAGAPAGTGILPTVAPTRTTPLTAHGTIVGTMQYMAPEQLEGKPVDHRADIFSLGALLYESIAGKRPFEGASQAAVIAAILEREPRPLSDIAASCPDALTRTIGRCLAKDPDDRWQSALDVKSELEWIAQQSGAAATAQRASAAAPAASRGTRISPMVMGLAVLGAAAMFGLGWMLHRPAPAPARLMRTSIVIPRGTLLDTDNASIALSPDGTMLAYAGRDRGSETKVSVRPLDSLTAQPLAGTEGASYPFWSPDGRQVGFFADRKLKRVPVSGGAVQTISDADDGRGASWGSSGMIVYSPRPKGGLKLVPAAGGAAVDLTTPSADNITHRNPRFLPDGRRLLYFSGTIAGHPDNGIFSLDTTTKATSLVLKSDSEGLYVQPGYMAFVKDGNLLIQPMDPATLRLSGEAVPVAENVQFNAFRYTGTYTFSSSGLLLFESGAIQGANQLTWYDLDGKRLETVGDPAIFWIKMAISPDGRRAAATIRHADGGSDLWMYDLDRRIGTRFTMGETNALVPIWSPDGRQIAYTDGSGALYVKDSDGSMPARKIFTMPGGSLIPSGWTRDGKSVLFVTQTGKTGTDVWIVNVERDPGPRALISTPANERFGALSRDGRWIAYTSDDSRRLECYVQPYPGPGGKWQISAQGAGTCGWIGTGTDLYYIDLEGRMFRVPLTPSGPGLSVGTPSPLFGGEVLPIVIGDFAPDGKRLLAATVLSGDVGPVLTLVTNWPAMLQR